MDRLTNMVGCITNMKTTLTPDETYHAIKLGAAAAIAESGLTPAQVEEIITKHAAFDPNPAFAKQAGNGAIAAIAEFLYKDLPMGMVLGGGAIGAGAGILHHDLDAAVKGTDDPDIIASDKKLEEYHRMTDDLKQHRSATGKLTV